MKRTEHPRGWWRAAGMAAGLAAALWVASQPATGLSAAAHRLAAVMALVTVWWVLEALPLAATALVGVGVSLALGITVPREVVSAFIDPVILLFAGSFLLAKALEAHGVDGWIARAILSHQWVRGSAARTIWALGLAAWCLAMWMSITACVAMLLPVALALGRGSSAAGRFGAAVLLFLVYAASAGAMATPVGTPPNLIGLAFMRDALGRDIGFLEWMAVGVPVAAVLLVVRFGIILWCFPPRTLPPHGALPGAWSGGWTREAGISVLVFGAAVCLWMAPGAAGLLLGHAHPAAAALRRWLVPGYVALLAAGALLGWPSDGRRRPVLGWREALRIDWATIALFGSGLALGRLMHDTGLSGAVGRAVLGAASVHGPAAVAAAAIVMVTVLSEIASNTAAAAMALPVIVSVLPADAAASVPVAGTLAASLGFMLPVSTPGNAMVYGTGAVPFGTMVRVGLLVDLTGMAVVWAAARWLVPLVLP